MLFQRMAKNTLLLTLCVAVIWQLALFIIGWALAPEKGPLGHMLQWDSGWYLHIIQYGYGLEGSPAAPAFYPLFPLLVKTLEFISLGLISPLGAALLINTAALWASLCALIGILRHFKASHLAKVLAALAFLALPSAFFMHTFYSEALFVAIGFWSYYFALQRKWYLVGISLAVLTACRLPSLLFVALCGLEFMRVYEWNIKKIFNKNLLWFLLAPLGFIAYGLYLTAVRGDFLAMFHAYDATKDWSYQVFNPNIFATLLDTVQTIITAVAHRAINYELFINSLLPLASLGLILAASVYVLLKLKKDGIPLFVFGLLSILLFTLNSNVVSVHRYALACIVIYVAVGLIVKRKSLVTTGLIAIAVIASLVIQLFLYSRFIAGVFAG